MLECLEKSNYPNQEPKYYVIWLHGLGADCHDFVPLVSELRLSVAVKFIFPNAPYIPITLNNGYAMRAWYDINSLERINHIIDNAGINKSVKAIEQIIASLIEAGINSTQIFLAGFSQGGVMSYTVGLKTQYKLAGILALSCYLPNGEVLAQTECINKNTPILAIHGQNDHVVPYTSGQKAYQDLKIQGFNISWREYPMEHNVCVEEINDMRNWFESIF